MRKEHEVRYFLRKRGKAVEVFFGSPNRPGNHWTLLYIDLTTNQWYYCDPYGWGTPKNIKAALLPIVATFYEENNLKPRSFKGCMQGSVPSGGRHIGSLKNLPIQTCANVCGVTAAILGGIASAAPILWRDLFLSDTPEIPEELKWLMLPSVYSDFLRCSLASWLVNGKVHLQALGIDNTPSSHSDRPAQDKAANEEQQGTPSKRRKLQSKLRRRQRKHQTLSFRDKRLNTDKIDHHDFIYVDGCIYGVVWRF